MKKFRQLFSVTFIVYLAAEEGQNYYEVFFTNENPFEELFSLAVVLLNRTWKEMKASVSDMSKVGQLVWPNSKVSWGLAKVKTLFGLPVD